MKAKTKAETTTWFRACAWGHVTSVQVAKETDKMLLLASVSPLHGQHRVGKETASGKYFPTFDAAREHAIGRLKEQIENATKGLADLNQRLSEVPDSADALGGDRK